MLQYFLNLIYSLSFILEAGRDQVYSQPLDCFQTGAVAGAVQSQSQETGCQCRCLKIGRDPGSEVITAACTLLGNWPQEPGL